MKHDCEYQLNPESGKCDSCSDIADAVASQSLLIEKLRESLEGMVNQFAYEGRPVKGVSSITTGGLSALEDAFDVLGYDDPQPMPHKQCNWAGCTEHGTCGVPSTKGYKRVCGKHSDKMRKGDLSGLAQEALIPQKENS